MAAPTPPPSARRGWTAYDPEWLVVLAREQHPDAPWLADALAQCRQAVGVGNALVHFASGRPEVEAPFVETIELDDPSLGLVLVDVLPDQRIGAIEIVSLLPG
jgi:hypothetical protein